ncbi:MAG: hypothetical protein K2H91_06320, partial [Lachnospiraceae bacterium]|nr:hypothetical protein [Lachnospiraceae bacterium]
RFLGNAGVPVAVFEQLKFFVRNHIVEGRVDLSKDALDSIILDLKNYIKCLGNIREWICNEIQNESVDIEELYLYITKIVISEAQPLIVARDNIENEIRYVFEMYMQNKFLKDFPLWDVLKGNYPDYVKSICIRAMIMWRGEECLRQVIAYLISICNLLPAYIDKELTQLCGQYIMESVLEEIEQRVSNAGVDLSSYYKRDEQMIQQYSKIVSEVYIFFWQKLYVCSRTELLYERLEWFLQDSNFNISLQEAKEIALRIMKGIEKDATEDDFKKAESIYNEIRKIAYLTIHNLTGMDLEGQNDDSPAYLYKAYFAPFAKHQRHVVEGVKYPRSLSGRSADERTESAIFSVFEARQNNTGGA